MLKYRILLYFVSLLLFLLPVTQGMDCENCLGFGSPLIKFCLKFTPQNLHPLVSHISNEYFNATISSEPDVCIKIMLQDEEDGRPERTMMVLKSGIKMDKSNFRGLQMTQNELDGQCHIRKANPEIPVKATLCTCFTSYCNGQVNLRGQIPIQLVSFLIGLYLCF